MIDMIPLTNTINIQNTLRLSLLLLLVVIVLVKIKGSCCQTYIKEIYVKEHFTMNIYTFVPLSLARWHPLSIINTLLYNPRMYE
jgi:hypothetical protein